MSFDADVIVVGGGLGGLSAAITAAKEGLSVIVLERGDYSGAKNVSGGRMYIHALQKLIPDALERAPLERPITKETFEFYCSNDRKLSFSFEEKGKKNSYSILRAKFDRWLASEAENLGVLISYSTLVTNAQRETGGINLETNRGNLRAPLVIDASGVTSVVFRYLGLRKFTPDKWMLGAKEIIKTDVNLPEDEGEVRTIVAAVKGVKGGGFVYTNKDTLSVGMAVTFDSLPKSEVPAKDLVEAFREKLGIEGEILEYSAHAIPYFGYRNLPPLYDNNLIAVGDSAGFLINDGFTIRGMDLAIGSGMIAGLAAKKLKEINDYTKTDVYYQMLKESFVLRHLELAYNRFSVINDPRTLVSYPEVLCNVLTDMFTVTEERKPLMEVALQRLKEKDISLTKALMDLMRASK
ncbi:FAD-dependent oxidoreductase [Sulfolobus acidocaldarius]|uniref:Dehydrogenase n=4 Tax=Sulfolobus acidocaldarius TaxID=2285 RepID=Q4JBX1_SULAC|nr:FAD-dependent oxidoreductase [Sulfolobus acidocaldarius]AAY79708.1 dehydrogenase [Sulfolobus acidocaldarius DSM 639]AGE70267.1 dehydrogenase [Sulfolobus acidocaldarius N8]AGE72542.1 dehydrogenase [Sulfolobus acidocaldarius Ron12/I]ALU29331.1 FAD-dependent oxidoreductase [Sulfolobus acidocaldarius]ALU32060.1 FAD-dependent oxidoreductase [Sulfolobus acidocaldarius]